jgi:hypothetical protein
MEESVERTTRRVLPWHKKGSEYLEGTAEEMEMVMFDWPGLRNKKGYSPPRHFTKIVL